MIFYPFNTSAIEHNVLMFYGAGIDGLEIAAAQPVQLVQVVVVPAVVGRAAEVPVGAVVGHDHAVLFQGAQDLLVHGRKYGDVHSGFQAQAQPHGRPGLGRC